MTVVSSWGCLTTKDERRSGDRLITAREGSPPWPCLQLCASSTLCPAAPHLVPAARVVSARSDRSWLREAGNRPDEANHLAGDRARDHDFRPAGSSQAPISRAQAELRFPGDVAHRRGQPLRGGREAYGSPEPTFG